MADPIRRVLCTSCGKEIEEHVAYRYNIGRKCVCLCPDCREQGTLDAKGHEVEYAIRKRRMFE